MTGNRHRSETAEGRAFTPNRLSKVRRVALEVHGSCTSPVSVRYGDTVDMEYHVRCRRCPGCLRARQYLWQLRAEAEWVLAPRTVMFTGTFARQSHDIEVCKEAVTRWLKRCRYHLTQKGGHEFRYLVVPERHKSGAWHVHSLMHSDTDLRYRTYRECWDDGFSYARVGDQNSASYVTKYVSKTLSEGNEAVYPRIRASRSPTYGAWVMERDAEKVKELLKANKRNEHQIWLSNLRQIMREAEKSSTTTMRDLLRPMEVSKAVSS